ncbi:PP2C family protein-serine/threonine phosphatase [Azospirillum sp.]|uniref:PP2C family protein-serine/threonine phosphatase n=1 Tax=Azospirillum sp. TaxID=34012 RepID=UPI002D5C1175|nr:SpoIIE family protein phosphatase [Azospirillum sp.]HYD64254.1 SpoIIE family protein phosphatase [Azospirillum sp.]
MDSAAIDTRSTGLRALVGRPTRRGAARLARWLATLGLRHVDVAAGGEEVLALAGRRPDLVLLDSGLADGRLIARLRAQAGMAEVPVLMIGRFAGPRERARILALGATDVIDRPATLAEVAARLRVHVENRSLDRSLREVIRSLQGFHTDTVERMKVARGMQLALLPSESLRGELQRRYGVRLDHHFESSSELGGDLWGARALGPERFAVFLCDFTGHGVAAALNTFRLHALMARIELPGDDPAAMLEALNGLLAGLLPETQFATMLYAVVDTAADRLTYATAGAPRPLVGTPDGGTVVGESVGWPLGVSPRATYRNREMAFPPGSFLFLFSDALYESRDWEGRPFGYEGVQELLRWSSHEHEGENVLAVLLERYFAVMPRPLADDLTAIWIGRKRD